MYCLKIYSTYLEKLNLIITKKKIIYLLSADWEKYWPTISEGN